MEDAETESGFQGFVVNFAKLYHWRVWHDNFSLWNDPGFPDLWLVKRGRKGKPGRLLVVELKKKTGKFSAAQLEWLADLETVVGIEVYRWRPADRAEIERVLAA